MTDASAEKRLRAQLTEAFEGADFPVTDQMDLVPALPQGPTTTFDVGEKSVSAMELAATISDHQDFPYDSVEALVEDVVAAMHEENLL